ncbi:MAG: hypothetical protein WAS21_26155, partial [Geminicoccaceae bacterium]
MARLLMSEPDKLSETNRRFGHRQLGARSVAWRREGGYRLGMISPTKPSYAGYRFPPDVISHTIWLYFRFPLSLRMVEEMLAARGIVVSHETV